MWGDMFFRLAGGDYFTNFNQDPKLGEIPEEVRQLVPENIHLVYWDYLAATGRAMREILTPTTQSKAVRGSRADFGHGRALRRTTRSASRLCARQ